MSDLETDRTVRVEGRGEIDPEILSWNRARKRPVVVDATAMPLAFEVETPEGTMEGEQGDVLIRGVEGELYPCDADVFAQTYELVGGGESPPSDSAGADGGYPTPEGVEYIYIGDATSPPDDPKWRRLNVGENVRVKLEREPASDFVEALMRTGGACPECDEQLGVHAGIDEEGCCTNCGEQVIDDDE